MDNSAIEEAKPLDECDFSSGYETQYRQEYRGSYAVSKKVPAPDPRLMWYRDLNTITILLFLSAVFLGGSSLLIYFVFTTNPLWLLLIIGGYVVFAVFMILMEVKSKNVR